MLRKIVSLILVLMATSAWTQEGDFASENTQTSSDSATSASPQPIIEPVSNPDSATAPPTSGISESIEPIELLDSESATPATLGPPVPEPAPSQPPSAPEANPASEMTSSASSPPTASVSDESHESIDLSTSESMTPNILELSVPEPAPPQPPALEANSFQPSEVETSSVSQVLSSQPSVVEDSLAIENVSFQSAEVEDASVTNVTPPKSIAVEPTSTSESVIPQQPETEENSALEPDTTVAPINEINSTDDPIESEELPTSESDIAPKLINKIESTTEPSSNETTKEILHVNSSTLSHETGVKNNGTDTSQYQNLAGGVVIGILIIIFISFLVIKALRSHNFNQDYD